MRSLSESGVHVRPDLLVSLVFASPRKSPSLVTGQVGAGADPSASISESEPTNKNARMEGISSAFGPRTDFGTPCFALKEHAGLSVETLGTRRMNPKSNTLRA